MLRDLTIQNYRCFKDFHIDGLARVNLIVGMNNSGKTSLLEAVNLLVNQLDLQCLLDLLHNRGEMAIQQTTMGLGETRQASNVYQIKHIFYGHQLSLDQKIVLQSTAFSHDATASPTGSQKDYPLSLNIQLKHNQPQIPSLPTSLQQFFPFAGTGMELDMFNVLLVFSTSHNSQIAIPVIDDKLIDSKFIQTVVPYLFKSRLNKNNSSLLLTTSHLSFEQLSLLWDNITLTPKEESVLKALQILEPNVERISFTSRQTANSGILIKIKGERDPIPLGTMGEGMHRILNLAMAAVTVENGFLLVDEIETGLHHETQTDMWRLVLEIAQQLNIQVFATTHSWDCVCAFQEALDEFPDSSIGKLFRLSQKGDTIRPVEYTPDELSVAVRQSIEVR